MERMTNTEEKIMHILWDIKKGFVKDVIEKMPSPKPMYTTVSSVIRILEKKGFVSYKAYGKTHEYFPKISKRQYRSFSFKRFLSDYFEGSHENVVSFMVKEKNLSPDEVREMLDLIDNRTKNTTNGS
ncbi:MAG: BlaI/MecI/CopY family transcriptional regulator [Flavobacteriales bacterium]|nr:BlaI/MecI/CopY family transcriptional regulator [Flavobacteriales bacterium]